VISAPLVRRIAVESPRRNSVAGEPETARCPQSSGTATSADDGRAFTGRSPLVVVSVTERAGRSRSPRRRR
jgi:hypothetical protein